MQVFRRLHEFLRKLSSFKVQTYIPYRTVKRFLFRYGNKGVTAQHDAGSGNDEEEEPLQ